MTADPYETAWTAPARPALTRLPEKVGTAIVEFCYGALAGIRSGLASPLKFDLAGLHSARRGDFRVIYRIDESVRGVELLAIEHRSDAYRPR